MVCDVCRHDAPYTHAQLVRRRQELGRNPTIDIYPCPDCGGRDYMLSEINLDRDPPPNYKGMLAREAGPPTYYKTVRRSRWYRLGEWWRRLRR